MAEAPSLAETSLAKPLFLTEDTSLAAALESAASSQMKATWDLLQQEQQPEAKAG
jgi:hypothetical protein